MTQEDKKLLLIDLCARLPYGVKVLYKYETWNSKKFATSIRLADEKIALSSKFNKEGDWFPVEEAGEILIKPYLRPMSSMTEEEYNSVNWNGCQHTISYDSDGFHFKSIKTFTLEIFYWLLKKKFDFMGLIEKGLAIRVTKENNPYEKFL